MSFLYELRKTKKVFALFQNSGGIDQSARSSRLIKASAGYECLKI